MAKKADKGFNATIESYHKVMGDIAKGELATIYLLNGEESYFIDKISEAITNTVPSEWADFDMDVLYGADSSAGEVIELCRTYPMGAARRVVVVREATQLSDIAKLEGYIQNPLPTTTLVICYKGKSYDKRSALYKKSATAGVVFESVVARDYEVKLFLSELLATRGFTIESKAKELLVEHLGSDITKIDNEIAKLMNAMPEGISVINSDHIERYVGISKEYNIFEFNDAVATADMLKMMRIASYFESNPKSAPLVMLLPTLFKHFLSIFSVGMIIYDCKKRGVSVPDKYALASQASLPSAFFVDKYIAASSLYPPPRVLRVLGYIRDCDMRSKGIGLAPLSEGELLRDLILKIVNSK